MFKFIGGIIGGAYFTYYLYKKYEISKTEIIQDIKYMKINKKRVKKVLLKNTKLPKDVINIIINTINRINIFSSKIKLNLYEKLNKNRNNTFKISFQINKNHGIRCVKLLLIKNNLKLIQWCCYSVIIVSAEGKSKDIIKLLENDSIRKMYLLV